MRRCVLTASFSAGIPSAGVAPTGTVPDTPPAPAYGAGLMFRNLGVAFAAALSLTAYSVPASAAIVTMTYTGVVTSISENVGGRFGAGDLVGQDFTARFVFDTTLGELTQTSLGQTLRAGGQPFISPTISASLTLNGVTSTIAGSPSGTYSAIRPYVSALSSSLQTSESGYLFQRILVSVSPLTSIQTFDDYSWSVADGQSRPGSGDFDFTEIDYISGYTNVVFGKLSVRSLTMAVQDAAAVVPEPASWALMLTGFGLAGGALRARRRLA